MESPVGKLLQLHSKEIVVAYRGWRHRRQIRGIFWYFDIETATHSGVLAWRIPGMGEPDGCHLCGHTGNHPPPPQSLWYLSLKGTLVLGRLLALRDTV